MSTKSAVINKAHALAPNMHALSSENIIYLMGFSFMLGSLFAILLLILLDFMRQQREKKR
jgi:hypothetical protein